MNKKCLTHIPKLISNKGETIQKPSHQPPSLFWIYEENQIHHIKERNKS